MTERLPFTPSDTDIPVLVKRKSGEITPMNAAQNANYVYSTNQDGSIDCKPYRDGALSEDNQALLAMELALDRPGVGVMDLNRAATPDIEADHETVPRSKINKELADTAIEDLGIANPAVEETLLEVEPNEEELNEAHEIPPLFAEVERLKEAAYTDLAVTLDVLNSSVTAVVTDLQSKDYVLNDIHGMLYQASHDESPSAAVIMNAQEGLQRLSAVFETIKTDFTNATQALGKIDHISTTARSAFNQIGYQTEQELGGSETTSDDGRRELMEADEASKKHSTAMNLLSDRVEDTSKDIGDASVLLEYAKSKYTNVLDTLNSLNPYNASNEDVISIAQSIQRFVEDGEYRELVMAAKRIQDKSDDMQGPVLSLRY